MRTATLILCVLIGPPISTGDDQAESLHQTASRRRPVAAVLLDGGQTLCVANHRSGSLSLIDLQTHTVVHEQRLGQQLSDIALLGYDGRLLITDQAAHQLLVVDQRGETFLTRQRIDLARHPVSVVVSPDESVIAVASLWSRRITLLSQSDSQAVSKSDSPSQITELKSQIAVTATLRLPFAPRLQLFVDDGRRLIVADAFGGQIAVVNVEQANVESIRELPAQNIRGMVLSADGTDVLLSHQILSPLARTDFDDIHWGNLLRNVVRELSLESILHPQADLLEDSRVIPLGQIGNGAADPAGITLLPELDGWMVALAGTNEVSVRTRQGGGRVSVAAEPTAIVWDTDRQRACVLCTLDDCIAIVNPARLNLVETITLGPTPQPTPADRGERLFADGRRSHDGWLSCRSCHPDGHTTGGLADTHSDDTFGTPKRILSLLGTRDNNPWAWNGQFRELHEQVASSFASTLQGEPLAAASVSDVVAYLHMLAPPPPIDEGRWTDEQQSQIVRGRALFNSLGCGRCHVPPQTFTIDQTFDVGLQDEAGLTKFNPPSLRGVSQRKSFFMTAGRRLWKRCSTSSDINSTNR